jgi:putative ABC transport system permease protein
MSGGRLYRLLLRAYPERFRARWADDMAALAADLLARERARRGCFATLTLAVRLGADGLRGAFLERLAERRRRSRSHPPERKRTMRDVLAHDLAGALRLLRRSPGHALAVVLTLGLGIGVNAAIFSVVRSVLLEALPFPDRDRLMLLAENNAERGWKIAQVAPANYLDWQEQARSLAGSAAFADWLDEAIAAGRGEPERVRAMLVAGDLFGVLGARPALGRSFRPEETWGEASRVAILSHHLWQRRFGGDPGALGQRLVLDGEPHTVIGVMPRGFSFWSDEVDVWRPFGWNAEDRTAVWFRRAHMLRVVGRLAPGVTAGSLQGELAAIMATLERRYPETNRQMYAEAVPLADWLVGEVRRPLLLLFAAAGLVLLIASVNVAHLQLARAAGRQLEDAVRSSLGASRGDLVRRHLLDSAILALLGAACGVALAAAVTHSLVTLGEAFLPRAGDVRVDLATIGFASLVALAVAFVAGLPPALGAARGAGSGALRDGGRAGERRATTRERQRLIAAEVALAMIVLVGTLLLARTMSALLREDAGFDPANVTVATVTLPGDTYPDDAAVAAFQRRLLAAVEGIPGVNAAGLTRRLPLTGVGWTSDFAVAGRAREEYGVGVMHREVTSGYFTTLRVPLVVGAPFSGTEDLDSPPVVIVNQALADRYFPGASPVGQRITFDRYPDESSVWREIVGVVGSERQSALGQPALPEIFAPLFQDSTRTVKLVVRSAMTPETLAPALRDRLRALDPGLPLFDVQTVEEVAAKSLARERFLLVLFGLFAGLALVLAALGVYGVTAESVAARRREIGVRLAVGARGGEVVRLMVRRQLVATAAGVLAGLLGAVGLGRAMAGMLHGVSALDGVSMGGAALALLALAALAAWVPARRGAAVEPLRVLR